MISRREERDALKQFYSSKKAELLVMHGRHGVGKTHLIDSHFSSKKIYFLKINGEKNNSLSEQISLFFEKVYEIFGDERGGHDEPVKNWQQAFKIFTWIINNTANSFFGHARASGHPGKALKTLDFRMRGNDNKDKNSAFGKSVKILSKSKKIVIFFNELPWLHTKNSDLLPALEYFLSQHWGYDKRIKLIISGSDGAWILDKIINNKSGLGKYVSQILTLNSLNLKQTKKFLTLDRNGVFKLLPDKKIAEVYMVMGGVPQHLSMLPKAVTAMQIIEKSAFSRNNFILPEFEKLIVSLFDSPKIYLQILKTIAADPNGISQEIIFKKLPKVSKGIGGLTKLRALEEAGLIRSFIPIYHNRKGIFYKINDELALFYFFWLEPIKKQLSKSGVIKNYWQKLQTTPKWQKWAAQAFELIAHKHSAQIATRLNLPPDAISGSWRYEPTKIEQGAQIDLLFDCDKILVLCEIVYSSKPIMIDKEYAEKLRAKIAIFQKITRCQKSITLAFITFNGIKKTIYSEEMLMGFVTLKDLFK